MILPLVLSLVFFLLILVILLALVNMGLPVVEYRVHSILKIDQERKPNAGLEMLLLIIREVRAPKILEMWIPMDCLTRAGIRINSGQFYSLWWLMILIGFLLFVLIVGLPPNSIISLVFAFLAMLGSVFFPYLLVLQKIKDREISIRKTFPIFLDLLTLSVDAGLGFFQALERVNRVQAGVLKQNINDMLEYQQLGFSREETLEKFVQDTQSDLIKRFAGAVNLSGKLGTPLSRTLRLQAHLLRTQRRQQAEIKAQTAPIRIIPALVFFFLPGLLLIYLAPPILHLLLR